MILIDFSGIMFASLHVDLKGGSAPNKEYIRHLCLNNIRAYNKQFRHEYGETVICYDSRSWRELDFPEYKYCRKNDRTDDGNDWDVIWEMFSDVQKEISEFMPYNTVQGLGAEADDIIGYICNNPMEKILIVSNDKDFAIFSDNPLIKQYRPFDNSIYEVPDPKRFLFDLIITGDKDDGIPSIKCADDFYKQQLLDKQNGIKPTRAPSISAKLKDSLWELYNKDIKEFEQELEANSWLVNYKRNKKLIDLSDLSNLPDVVVKNIEISFNDYTRNPDNKMIKFFQEHRMYLLGKHITDFQIMKIKPTLT